MATAKKRFTKCRVEIAGDLPRNYARVFIGDDALEIKDITAFQLEQTSAGVTKVTISFLASVETASGVSDDKR